MSGLASEIERGRKLDRLFAELARTAGGGARETLWRDEWRRLMAGGVEEVAALENIIIQMRAGQEPPPGNGERGGVR